MTTRAPSETRRPHRERNRRSRLFGCIAAAGLGGLLLLGACGDDDDDERPIDGSQESIPVVFDNQVPLPAPCMGASLTFFSGTTPIDVPYQNQRTIQVAQLFGSYQIGFQVNGWYWRSCTAPGDCPNPRNCQNPDNAGQVAVQIASDCSSATLLTNWDEFTCDSSVPNASNAVAVTLESSNPCTVRISGTATPLQPTEGCCSCNSCSGSAIPPGQVPHCQ